MIQNRLNYYKLIEDKFIAQYTHCEIETIYAHSRQTNNIYIILSRVKFKEGLFDESNSSFNSQFRLRANQIDYNFGVHKEIRDLKFGHSVYESLSKGIWYTDNPSLKYIIGELKEYKPKYIKSNPTNYKNVKDSTYNRLLSITSTFTNPDCGSYLIEFFDNEKTEYDFLFQTSVFEVLKQIQNSILTVSDLCISDFPDKIGGVFFEFPIKLIELKRLQDNCKIVLKRKKHIYGNVRPKLLSEYFDDDYSSLETIRAFPRSRIISFEYNQIPVRWS